MLEMNKEEFLKTEFGSTLKECITAWDHWLAELKEFRFDPSGQEYRTARKAADWCQAQWKIFQMAIRQFYGIRYDQLDSYQCDEQYLVSCFINTQCD